MIAPQLTGRLLAVLDRNSNIQKLIKQCDEEGPKHNALVPTYHCMHTPGGPLKFSLEGHPFAVFAFRLTSDYRYIVSVSNKFITWDVSTSDLCRQVHPQVEGLMMDLEISPDSRYIAAYTNNSQTILLNALVSEFIIIDNPLGQNESIQGLVLLDTNLIIYGQYAWSIFNMSGKETRFNKIFHNDPILAIQMVSTETFSIIHWSGDTKNPRMSLATHKEDGVSAVLEFHSGIALNDEQTKAWVCSIPDNNDLVMWEFKHGNWYEQKVYETNPYPLIQIKLSPNEEFVMGTFINGFQLWKTGKTMFEVVENARNSGSTRQRWNRGANRQLLGMKHVNTFFLPHGIRNVSKKMNKSNNLVLSANNKYAIAGIRKVLYIWDVKTADLVKYLDAHFARIIDVQPLTVGNWNTVVTSSIDRTVKVWNINYIFEKTHHIDRHELPIDSVSLCTAKGIAVTVTRGCIGIWDLLTGKLKSKMADSALGAIITHAIVTSDGKYIISAESGFVLYWDLSKEKVIYREEQKNILQVMLYENETKSAVVSRLGVAPNVKALCITRTFPEGEVGCNFEFAYKNFKNIILSPDEKMFVAYGSEKFKDTLYAFDAETGENLHKFLVKYQNFKDVSKIVPIPDKPGQVALIDQDKANLIDVAKKAYVKSIPNWGGACDTRGRYGLYAPPKGGLDLLDLRTGTVKLQLIPKIAEGIFNVICKFNATNEYVIYYHSGRKTLRVFNAKEGNMIANYRVPSDLTSIETTTDGNSVVLGMVDGNLTVLTIADPNNTKKDMKEYLEQLPSRQCEKDVSEDAGK